MATRIKESKESLQEQLKLSRQEAMLWHEAYRDTVQSIGPDAVEVLARRQRPRPVLRQVVRQCPRPRRLCRAGIHLS